MIVRFNFLFMSVFQTVVENSNVLSDAEKDHLLSMELQMTDDQIANSIQYIKDADNQYEESIKNTKSKKVSLNKKYLDGLKDFTRHKIPVLMKEAEKQDRRLEGKKLENILSSI
jgi:hypothetical protein